MSTSNDTTYSVDRDEIIKYAYQLISAIGEGETPSADKVTDASRALNMMIKAWVAHGLQIWKVSTITIDPLVLDKATYTMGESKKRFSIQRRVLRKSSPVMAPGEKRVITSRSMRLST